MAVKCNRNTMIEVIRITFYDGCRAMPRNRTGHFVAFAGNADTAELHRFRSAQNRAAVSGFIAFTNNLKHKFTSYL
ncbi:hypothetical protein ABW07_23435 [Pluralibacter gergoviae]|nr:hypothetical protein ABW07_23435 [Pluralibacter gergoviae]